jgi:hypothetical protein
MTATQTEILKAIVNGASVGSYLNSFTLTYTDGRSSKVLPTTVQALVTGGYLRRTGDNLAAAYRLTLRGHRAAR